jgi:hypothetical protein
MDWNLIWSAVNGIAAALALLFAVFIEWPRFRMRLSESRSTINNVFGFIGQSLLLGGSVLMLSIIAVPQTPPSSRLDSFRIVFLIGILFFFAGGSIASLLARAHKLIIIAALFCALATFYLLVFYSYIY